tara:strand:- start:3753 stop:4070 length:318 start_codon:yes stop_codon:yes gene_type:complete
MAKCYVVQRSNHDLSGLQHWGEPVTLFQQGFFPDDVAEHREAINAHLDKVFMNFNPHTDFIVPIGCMATCMTVADYLATLDNVMGYNVLKWDRKYDSYYAIYIGE